MFFEFEFKIMSDDEDFTIDASTRNVLLYGELLRDKSSHESIEAAIYRRINVSKVNNVLGTERAITSYFMFLLYHGKSLADTTWLLPKRAKVETPPKYWILSVSRAEVAC